MCVCEFHIYPNCLFFNAPPILLHSCSLHMYSTTAFRIYSWPTNRDTPNNQLFDSIKISFLHTTINSLLPRNIGEIVGDVFPPLFRRENIANNFYSLNLFNHVSAGWSLLAIWGVKTQIVQIAGRFRTITWSKELRPTFQSRAICEIFNFFLKNLAE